MKKLIFTLFALILCVSVFAQEKKNTFYLAFEGGTYSYREPHMQYPISVKGDKMGASFEWIGRSVLSNDITPEDPSFATFEVRYMTGDAKYEGWLMNPITEEVTPTSSDGEEDHYFEARITLGKTYDLNDTFTLWPFLGIAYRRLYNNSYIEGGYKRISNYGYMPLGLKLSADMGSGWMATLSGEFDWLIYGKQKSGIFEKEGYGYVVNQQKQGYGLRGSIKLEKTFSNKFGIFVEPYYRMWKIQNSEETVVIGYDPVEEAYWAMSFIEPFNVTKEAGIKVGITF